MSFDIESEAKLLQNSKREWIERERTLGGDPKVIEFISNVLFHGVMRVTTNDSVETIRSLFEAGYCYYFALMLEDAFPGGDVCLMYPFGHITYVYDGIIYDIGGVSDNEYEALIPIKYLGASINVFKHNGDSDVSKEDGRRVADECIKQGKVINGNGYFALQKEVSEPQELSI